LYTYSIRQEVRKIRDKVFIERFSTSFIFSTFLRFLTFVIFFWNVLPARRYAIAGLCDNNVFVRPFVTSWYCVKVS